MPYPSTTATMITSGRTSAISRGYTVVAVSSGESGRLNRCACRRTATWTSSRCWRSSKNFSSRSAGRMQPPGGRPVSRSNHQHSTGRLRAFLPRRRIQHAASCRRAARRTCARSREARGPAGPTRRTARPNGFRACGCRNPRAPAFCVTPGRAGGAGVRRGRRRGVVPRPATRPRSRAACFQQQAARAAAGDGLSPVQPVQAVDPHPLRIDLATRRPVWLRVTVDGRIAIEREAAAGEQLPFAADRTIVVRAGDAGAVTVRVGGVDQGPVGRDGQVLTRGFAAPAR